MQKRYWSLYTEITNDILHKFITVSLFGYFTPAMMTSYYGKYMLFGFLESSGLVNRLDIYKIKNSYMNMFNEYNKLSTVEKKNYFDSFTKLLTNISGDKISASSPKLKELYTILHKVIGNKFINLNAECIIQNSGLLNVLSSPMDLFSVNDTTQILADLNDIYKSYSSNDDMIKHEHDNMMDIKKRKIVGDVIRGTLTSETFKGLVGGNISQLLSSKENEIVFSVGSGNYPIGIFNNKVDVPLFRVFNSITDNIVMNLTGSFYSNPKLNMDKSPQHKLTLSEKIDV